MFIIYGIADIRCLREAHVVPAALLDVVDEKLHSLHSEFGDGHPLEDFSLAGYGPVVILQRGDGPGVFELLDLPGGLLIRRPEWMGRDQFGRRVLFQAIVMRNNEQAVYLYIPARVDTTMESIVPPDADEKDHHKGVLRHDR